jgi:hypothetical protein
MSKIDDLIEELCPNGVNFVELKAWSQLLTGGR